MSFAPRAHTLLSEPYTLSEFESKVFWSCCEAPTQCGRNGQSSPDRGHLQTGVPVKKPLQQMTQLAPAGFLLKGNEQKLPLQVDALAEDQPAEAGRPCYPTQRGITNVGVIARRVAASVRALGWGRARRLSLVLREVTIAPEIYVLEVEWP